MYHTKNKCGTTHTNTNQNNLPTTDRSSLAAANNQQQQHQQQRPRRNCIPRICNQNHGTAGGVSDTFRQQFKNQRPPMTRPGATRHTLSSDVYTWEGLFSQVELFQNYNFQFFMFFIFIRN